MNYYVTRSVPFIVSVDADSDDEALRFAGYRIDDALSDAQDILAYKQIAYHGDGIIVASGQRPSPLYLTDL